MSRHYVHGYHERESARLEDQATCLADLLHHDSLFPEGSLVLEAGCGVGAQTAIVAPRNPGTKFISIDISPESIERARATLALDNVEFRTGDINALDFPDAHFDHILLCFVLEHLADPAAALRSLGRVLKKGGTLMVIEGDHGSAFFHPASPDALAAVNAQVILQAKSGGNALIGRELYPLLVTTGYRDCRVSPRQVYVDASRPALVEGFTRNTFTAMIEGVQKRAIGEGIIDAATFDRGIAALKRTAAPDGVFCYTFFKGIGQRG